MTTIRDISKYLESNIDLLDETDEALKLIVKEMEKNILNKIAFDMKYMSPKAVEDYVIDQIYKAEYWKEIQEGTYKTATKQLDKFFGKYKKNIDELKKIYPKSDFQSSALTYEWNKYSKFIKEDLDVLKLMRATESDTIGLARMSQANLIVTLRQDVTDSIVNQLRLPTAHLQTRMTTTTNVINNNIRHSFFKSIKTLKPKKYIYAGVRDSKNRPFCRFNIGKVKTETGWKNTDNDQVGDAWTYAGGYNCRHVTLLVSENWTDEEVKQIQSDFRSL